MSVLSDKNGLGDHKEYIRVLMRVNTHVKLSEFDKNIIVKFFASQDKKIGGYLGECSTRNNSK